jgi:acyl carrier protein phosphodiesterase
MNFLAHLYLSGGDDDLMIGNFIGDHIRGNAINDLPERIRQGVLLHRKIDQFTDQHPIVHQTRIRIRPHFGKYSVVASDLFYDHFLASRWNEYSKTELHDFADGFYRKIEDYHEVIPERTKHMLTHMIPHNWLVGYASLQGIGKAMKGMSRRASFTSGLEKGEEVLLEGYEKYGQEFSLFFPELIGFVRNDSGIDLIQE